MNPDTQDFPIAEPPSSIDDLVFTASARNWFTQLNLLPSSWGLNPHENQRIVNAGVALTIFNSPACIMPLGEIRTTLSSVNQIVVIDAKRFDIRITGNIFTRDEVIATLLHEIGHWVNPLPLKYWSESEEFWADDYARHCGFQDHLLSALDKLISHDSEGFDKPITFERIKRIKDGVALRLSWELKDKPPTLNVSYPTSF